MTTALLGGTETEPVCQFKGTLTLKQKIRVVERKGAGKVGEEGKEQTAP